MDSLVDRVPVRQLRTASRFDGDVITRENAAASVELLPPSVQLMLKHGMRITVVPYEACPGTVAGASTTTSPASTPRNEFP
jgi:hypothetical protein